MALVTVQVPPVKVAPPSCVTVFSRLSVPEVTETVPVLLKGTPTWLVVLTPAELKTPWLLKVLVPLKLLMVAPLDRFQLTPGLLVIVALDIMRLAKPPLRLAVPKFTRVRLIRRNPPPPGSLMLRPPCRMS